MKKFISLFLALMLVVSLAVSASATANGTGEIETGSIAISGASELNTYSIYRLLDLESYDIESEAYSYKVAAKWANFFATDAAKAYMTVDTANYATWYGEDTADRVIAFSKLALQYAQENHIAPEQVSTEVEGFNKVDENGNPYGLFSDLPLGYYLVDSTMGALCGLTTTHPNATISAKNSTPTIDKQIQENSTGNWGASNTAGIGDKIEYRVTVNVTGGAQNYVLHDTMSAGLTFNPDSVSITRNGSAVDASNFTVTLNPNNHHTPTKDGAATETQETYCTFHVSMSKAFCDTLNAGDQLIIYYNATLNANAKIGEEPDTNHAILEFGESHHTTEDVVTTNTYGFEIVKTDSSSTKLLDGAQFRLYKSADGNDVIRVVAVRGADGKIEKYRVAEANEVTTDATMGDIIEVSGGRVKVEGLDYNVPGDYYYLEEIQAPEGYNKLTARQPFQITNGNLYATFVGESYTEGTGVQVKNKTGSVLPTTGAMGTTMFLTFGSLVVLATGVLLVTKKRMTMIEE